MSESRFENPILRGDYSDPDVIRVGDKYYMISSTFQLYPGMVILESTDLINWKTVNYCVPHPEILEPKFAYDKMGCYNNGLYAGSLRYLEWNEKQPDGTVTRRHKWFMHTTIFMRGIIVSTADDVYGEWKTCFMKDKNGRDIIAPKWDDNCPYWEFNEDGTLKRAYMIASKPGSHWYTRIFEMSLDGITLLDADVRFMEKDGDFTRVRTGKTPDGPEFAGVESGDPVDGDIIDRYTGEVIPTSRHITQNHVMDINAEGDIGSVIRAIHIPDREGTVINDTPSAEASKIIRFGEDTLIGNTYFSGRHGEHEKVSDYVYIFSSEWWDGFRFPILKRAKCIYGDIFDADGNYVCPGSKANPGCYETQRLNVNVFDPVDTREPNQGGYVDVPPSMSADGREHWYFLTHHGKQDVYADCRPMSLLPVTWVEGWPLFGILPEGDKRSSGVPTVMATQYDGTGITPDADPTVHHPHARFIPGIMDWNPHRPPIKGEHKTWRYQDSDNFGEGEHGGMQNSTPDKLSPNWQWNHAPRVGYWSLSERLGFLRLYAFPTADGSRDFFKVGNVICQRYLTEDHVTAECKIDLSHMAVGQEAGFAHLNGGVDSSTIGVRMTDSGECRITVDGRLTEDVVTCGEIIFRTEVESDRVNKFYYSTDGGDAFREIGSGFVLCTGNYRGDYIGMYTYNNDIPADSVKGEGGYIDIDYFHYEY